MDSPERDPSPDPSPEKDSSQRDGRRSTWNAWLPLLLTAALVMVILSARGQEEPSISYDRFRDELLKGNVLFVKFFDRSGKGQFRDPPLAGGRIQNDTLEVPRDEDKNIQRLPKKFRVIIPEWLSESERAELTKLLSEKTTWEYQDEADNTLLTYTLLTVILPLGVLLLFLWIMFRRTRDQFMGGGFLSGFTRSPAKRYEQADHPITFDDVAGLESVKQDLEEVVEFLKEPELFQRLGGRVPKGVLLNGPPGTGKTLLARAVAGEAGVPFYSVSGSEFIQMFVGVGASRVRDLFRQAKENAPAIIFVDEIDAVGRQRGAGLGGGHDEREQTLNQILSEMDGFTRTDSVIVLAATNRPDVLDPALLRPGRFDRHVTVDRPTLKGRLAIFKVHVREVPLSEDVDLQRLAEATVGLTGADIRNLVNEAALWATRNKKQSVSMDDFEHARDKVLMGPKREELLLGDEKRKTAYHEAGHALLAWLSEGVDRVHKVTVIPRGRSLGVTQILPEEDRLNVAEHELRERLAFLLAGRAAEKLIFDEFSAGAENDLERATSLARNMVTRWGMSPRMGPVSYKLAESDPFLGRELHEQRKFSEQTLRMIDEEVARILHEGAEHARQVLVGNRGSLDTLAEGLLEQEELSEQEIVALIGPSVHHEESSDDVVESIQ